MTQEEELKILKNKLNLLKKRDDYLIITDFDDTIFSRKEQLEKSELLRNNRWDKWNEVMKNIIWFENIIRDYYLNKIYPTIITSKLRLNHDLILTAWYKELQSLKIKACNLDNINYIVVSNAEEKIIETIKYIVEYLKFIPNKIIIYEDRPKYFIKNKLFLEEFLGVRVEIMFVEMIDNISKPKITKKRLI